MKQPARIPAAILAAIVLHAVVDVVQAATGATNDYNPYNYTIPDNGPSTNSDLLLSGAPSDATITKVKIYYEIKHPRPSDLDVWLTCWNNGWQGDYFLHYQGDSSSVDRITVDNIHTWDGKTPNVTWYLVARDRVSGQIGYIDFFELWVTYSYNEAPDTPNSENPTDGASSVSVDANLDWSCSDPDDDTLYFTVYFGKNNSSPDVVIKNDAIGSNADPGTLDYSSHYYWQVKADDHKGGVTWSPVWDFYTEAAPITSANITIANIGAVVAGNPVTVNYTVTNTGNYARSYGVGAEIRQGATVVANLDEQTTSVISPNATASGSFTTNIPASWSSGTYTARAAVWTGTPGSSTWLNSFGRDFTVQQAPLTITGKLAYHSYSEYLATPIDADDGHIFLFPLPNGTPRRLTQGLPVENAMNPHISPDGARVTFMAIPQGAVPPMTPRDYAHVGPYLEIYVYDLATDLGVASLARLTTNNAPDEDPKFSPDGQKIVFKRSGQIWTVNTDGGSVTQLTTTAREKSGPCFSPDGIRIVFWYDSKSSADVGWMLANTPNSDTVLFGDANYQDMYPIYRDADTILYSRWENADANPAPPNPSDDAYAYSISTGVKTKLGSTQFNLSNTEDADAFPLQSTLVGFSSTRSVAGAMGSYDIYIGNPQTDAIYQLSGMNSRHQDLGGWYSPYSDARKIVVLNPASGAQLTSGSTVIVTARGYSNGGVWSGATPKIVLQGPVNTEFTGLHDDGINGDQTAGDGIYSISVTLPTQAGNYTVYASANSTDNGINHEIRSASIVVTLNGPVLPAISGFAPASGAPGTTITINGANFIGTTAVRFDGASAPFSVNSATEIVANVPDDGTSGPITVTTPAGTATSTDSFTVLPLPPAPPTNVQASDGFFSDKIRVTWTGAAGATSYEVWRSSGNDPASATKISSPDPTASPYDDTTASQGTTYWYWVKAKSASGASGFSDRDSGSVAVVVLNPENGHYYQLIAAPLTWTAAKTDAESRSHNGWPGHLTTITSAAENDFVLSLVPGAVEVFAGGFQPEGSPEPAGNWQWVTGEPFDYANAYWAGEEPNNSNGEDFLAFRGQGSATPGKWNDVGNVVHAYLVEFEPPPPPSNDLFSGRISIDSSGGTVSGSNVGATKESGEPNHAGNPGGKSVWWTWTPSHSGTADIQTSGSDFDTTLGVYTGSAVDGLTEVASDNNSGAGTASRVIFSVTAGTAYQIAVDGYDAASGSISLTVAPPVPAPPTGVQASDAAFPDKIRVTWTASAGATSYEIWRSTGNDPASATKISNPDPTASPYDDTTASQGTTYWYWVKAKNASGTSDFSERDSGSLAPPVPLPPTSVQASDAAFPDKIRVTWTASTGATSYEIWRSTGNDPAGATKISNPDPTASPYDDTAAGQGTYWYWVKAKNDSGTSDFSERDSGSLAPTSGFVLRVLPAGYAPGVKLIVTLNATPSAGTQVYAVEDSPPLNWTVSNISHGGTFDGTNRKVKFDPFFDATARALTYEVTPPANESGIKQFAGTGSADGVDSAIGGQSSIDLAPYHPADNNPADYRMVIGEVTAYGAAWKTGQTWPIDPNPIPIGYVTRAGALWKGGENYTFDPGATAPLWWVNVTGQSSASRVTKEQQKRAKTAAVSNVSLAARALLARGVTNVPFTVTVFATPSVGVSAWAVEDKPPTGWQVSNITEGGAFDAVNQKVKWGPFFDNTERTLSYDVSPLGGLGDSGVFTGTCSFDGVDKALAGQGQVMLIEATPLSHLGSPAILPRGEAVLSFLTIPGRTYVLDASTDLLVWTPIYTNTAPNGALFFRDSGATNFSGRFYRVREQ